jgi:hypothetical protein
MPKFTVFSRALFRLTGGQSAAIIGAPRPLTMLRAGVPDCTPNPSLAASIGAGCRQLRSNIFEMAEIGLDGVLN